jgi:hypothetical protein
MVCTVIMAKSIGGVLPMIAKALPSGPCPDGGPADYDDCGCGFPHHLFLDCSTASSCVKTTYLLLFIKTAPEKFRCHFF